MADSTMEAADNISVEKHDVSAEKDPEIKNNYKKTGEDEHYVANEVKVPRLVRLKRRNRSLGLKLRESWRQDFVNVS